MIKEISNKAWPFAEQMVKCFQMMKKILLAALLFFLIFSVNPKTSKAAVSCPSGDMSCQQLSIQGGCASGCVNIMTGGGKSPTYCHCEVLKTDKNLSCGSTCQTSDQCGSACGYCRASGPGTPSTCQAAQTPPSFGTSAPAADIHGDCGENGISTAIGCLDVLGGQSAFLGAILRWAVGIGGGIAFLLIVYAGFMIMTSAGNPERLKAGQELLTSAISGIILLIFSIFVLRFIGIDILGLGAFGFSTK